MSKSWSWWVPICIGAISACHGDDDGPAPKASLVVTTSGCPDEQALLFVDDDAVFNGPVTGLGMATTHVTKGKHHVALWIDGVLFYQRDIEVVSGRDELTLDAPRSVECPDDALDAGPEGGDAGKPDGGETDGGADAGTVTLLEPCSADDDSLGAAQTIAPGNIEDALCGAGDVDYFAFSIGDRTLSKVTLSIAGLESALAGELRLYDEDGTELDVQTDEGEDAVVHFSLLGSRQYFLRIADLTEVEEDVDAGTVMNPYKLSLEVKNDEATVEASAGTFHGASNNADDDAPAELEGSYVATSVHGTDNEAVAYKVLASVKLPGAEAEQFVYDPSDLADGVLRIVFYDGIEPLVRRAAFTRFPGWFARPLVRDSGLQLLDSFDGNVVIEFPTQKFTRSVDAAAMLDVPTVTAATPSGDPTTLAVTLSAPAGATKYAASAFGTGEAAAHGTATATSASFDVVLDAKLEADEAFTMRVQATDGAFIALPLPETSNVSEYIYYSDESAQQ